MNGSSSLRAALVVLLLAAACSAPPPRSVAPPRLPEASKADGAEVDQRALLLLMVDRQQYEPVTLEAMLDASPTVRKALAAALGRIGDPRGRTLLQGLLVDSEVEVRREAAFMLGVLGAKEAERSLIVASVDDDPEVGQLAVEALGKLEAPLGEVRRALGALDPADARRRLAPSLFRFPGVETIEAARDLLAVADPELRSGAAYALSRVTPPEGRALLRRLVADPDAQIRAWAARGLGESGELVDLARLKPLLVPSDPSPTIQALFAGARLLGRVDALPPLDWGDAIARLTGSSNPGIRGAAIQVAGTFLPHPGLEETLRGALASGDLRSRELALQALTAGGVPDLAALAAEAAASPERILRAAAAGAAGVAGDLDLLDRLRRDREAQVRAAAVSAAVAAGDRAPAFAALDDPDPVVRATALDLLGDEPALGADRIAERIDAARADGAQNDVRLTGIRLLVVRAQADGARERTQVLEALERLAGDRDYLVRRAAADGLAELGVSRPAIGAATESRDLAAYREILLRTERPRRVVFETERGRLDVELACPQAPLTCLSFLQLAEQGYFDGIAFHRVVPDFVVQGGDPRGDGWGGPGYAIRDEINRLRYRRGAIGMALSGPDTGGSQFFFTLSPQWRLDGGYTVFGRVVGGDAVLDRIVQGDRMIRVREAGPGGTGGLR